MRALAKVLPHPVEAILTPKKTARLSLVLQGICQVIGFVLPEKPTVPRAFLEGGMTTDCRQGVPQPREGAHQP